MCTAFSQGPTQHRRDFQCDAHQNLNRHGLCEVRSSADEHHIGRSQSRSTLCRWNDTDNLAGTRWTTPLNELPNRRKP